MDSRKLIVAFWCCVLLCGFSAVVVAQNAACKCTPPQSDTSFIDAQGTAHITRVVPVPDTLSSEAQKAVSVAMPDTAEPEDLPKRRAQASAWQVNGGEQMRKTSLRKLHAYPWRDEPGLRLIGSWGGYFGRQFCVSVCGGLGWPRRFLVVRCRFTLRGPVACRGCGPCVAGRRGRVAAGGAQIPRCRGRSKPAPL